VVVTDDGILVHRGNEWSEPQSNRPWTGDPERKSGNYRSSIAFQAVTTWALHRLPRCHVAAARCPYRERSTDACLAAVLSSGRR
jgi:hypothetical protein